MNKTIYLITCGSKDADGYCKPGIEKINDSIEDASEATLQLAKFLGNECETYVDERGFVHEIYENVDQVFGKYLDNLNINSIYKLVNDLTIVGLSDRKASAIAMQAFEIAKER